jgi:hypothetical protein
MIDTMFVVGMAVGAMIMFLVLYISGNLAA